VWHGPKAPHDKLWNLDLADIIHHQHPTTQTGTAFQTIKLDIDAEFVAFTHAMLASCPISTMIKAVEKGWLSNYPKLTANMIRTNPPVSRAIAMGYLDQTRQGQHSTHPSRPKPTHPSADPDDADEDNDDPSLRFQVLPVSDFATNSSNDPGRFPFPTKSGWNYLLVSTMNGYVHLELMANSQKKEYLRVYQSTYDFYISKGKTTTTQRLDNETSFALESFLRLEQVEVQYAPPGIHRQNPSERAIRHAKNALIAMCVTTDPAFPAEILFEDAIPQAEIAINLVRPWHPDPDRSKNAWTGMHNKPYDHMTQPLSIYDMKVVVHNKPDARATWATHGTDGFYVGPAMQHYRCWRCYMPEMRAIRITDTIAWLPLGHTMPGHSHLKVFTAAVTDLATAVRHMTSAEPTGSRSQCRRSRICSAPLSTSQPLRL
jgi:hypothetical protein